MEESRTVKGKFRQFRPHKNLNEGWRYFKIQGSETIITTRINIVKAFQVVEQGGQPVIEPNTKQPSYEWDLNNEIKVLTRDEYDEIQKSGWDD
jgi:hypothetical protein